MPINQIMSGAAVDGEYAAMAEAKRSVDEERKLRIEGAFTALERFVPGAGEKARYEFRMLLQDMGMNRK